MISILPIETFPFIWGNIPEKPVFEIYITQWYLRYL